MIRHKFTDLRAVPIAFGWCLHRSRIWPQQRIRFSTLSSSSTFRYSYSLWFGLLLLSGCANLNSVYREFDVEKSRSVSIDAKQRVVIATPRKYWDPQINREITKGVSVCAEPSPDALSAYANSVGASAQGSNGEAQKLAIQGALSASESAAFVGLRTQTIQLLRDGMYRICEGYLSGALGEKEFATLQRRYQNLMMGLLAIEQLTGAVTPRPVTLNTAASSGTGGDTQKEQDAVAAAQKTLATDNAALAKAKNDVEVQDTKVKAYVKTLADKKSTLADKQRALASTPPTTSTADVKSASDDVSTANDDLNSAKKTLSDLKIEQDLRQANSKADTDALRTSQDALVAAQLRVNASTSTRSDVADNQSNKMDPETSKALAVQIEKIVQDVISTSFIQDTCLSVLTNSDGAAYLTADERLSEYKNSEPLRVACVQALSTQVTQYSTK